MPSYIVRFKGHVCAGVMTGLNRHPILLRARKGEPVFRAQAPDPVKFLGPATDDNPAFATYQQAEIHCRKIARAECARAIKRTEYALWRLRGDHLLRGVKSVERLLQLVEPRPTIRRGKRWKICLSE